MTTRCSITVQGFGIQAMKSIKQDSLLKKGEKQLMFSLLLTFLIILTGCSHTFTTTKSEISDYFLERLSRDLAEIDLMVEKARNEYKPEGLTARVIETWSEPLVPKFIVGTPSGREEYRVLARSKIAVPSSRGYMLTTLLKLKGEKEKFIGVVKPEAVGAPLSAVGGETKAGDYSVRFYDWALAHDKASYDAIKQYVSITSVLEKVAKEILDKLADVKKKYENSPIYIEGFTIELPIISVQIQFRFKK
jgi:hypothetical protein